MDTQVETAALSDVDEHEWLWQPAAPLAAGRLGDVDAAHLSNYLESRGRFEEREVRSRTCARGLAAAETGMALSSFPTASPWSLEEAFSIEPQRVRDHAT